MNTATKIQLSTLETELIQNKEWILTKRSIIEKVYHLFGITLESYKKIVTSEDLSFAGETTGKISKGENYHGLPYVILDYPGIFTKENIFAIRTMFWWGNFFSISLHLSGTFFRLQNDFSKSLQYLQEKYFFVCNNENQWQHTFDSSNYIAASKLSDDEFNRILEKKFFKISKKIEVNRWNDVPNFLEKTFSEMIKFVQVSFPGDETNPLPGFPKAGSGL